MSTASEDQPYIDLETAQRIMSTTNRSGCHDDVTSSVSHVTAQVSASEEKKPEKEYIDVNSVRDMLEKYKSLSRSSVTQTSSSGAVVSGRQTADDEPPIYAVVNKHPLPPPTTKHEKPPRPKVAVKPIRKTQTTTSDDERQPPCVTSSPVVVIATTEYPATAVIAEPLYSVVETSATRSQRATGNTTNDSVDVAGGCDDGVAAVATGSSMATDYSIYESIADDRRPIVQSDASNNNDDGEEQPYATFSVPRPTPQPADMSADAVTSSSLTITSQTADSSDIYRFTVRSIGSLPLKDDDLAPAHSAPAIIDCIQKLTSSSGSHHTSADNWPTDKDLSLELNGGNLDLLDAGSKTILNRQPLRSIRLWGTGQEKDSRHFAYVSRDRSVGGPFMCHVFQCCHPGVHASHIVLALRDVCSKRAAATDAKASSSKTTTTTSSSVKT